jgi:hypothetical protein
MFIFIHQGRNLKSVALSGCDKFELFDDLDTSTRRVMDTAMQGLSLYQSEDARRDDDMIKFLEEPPRNFEVRELLALGAEVSLWNGPRKDEGLSRGEVTLYSFRGSNLVLDLEKEEFQRP